jgi:hypothetical protein
MQNANATCALSALLVIAAATVTRLLRVTVNSFCILHFAFCILNYMRSR